MTPGCFVPQVESPQRVLEINTSGCQFALACGLLQASLYTDQTLKPWARKMTNKKPRKYNGMVAGPDVQTEKKTQNNMVI